MVVLWLSSPCSVAPVRELHRLRAVLAPSLLANAKSLGVRGRCTQDPSPCCTTWDQVWMEQRSAWSPTSPLALVVMDACLVSAGAWLYSPLGEPGEMPISVACTLGFWIQKRLSLSLHPFHRSTRYGAQDFQCWMRNHLTKTLRSWVWAIRSHCFRYSGCWLSRSWSVSPRELPVSLNFKRLACCIGSLNHMLPQLHNILCLKRKAEIEVTYNGTK